MSARWKTYERKVAKFFGSHRTPLSGINSRHDTSSDTLHAKLYVEAKSAAGVTGTNGWLFRWLRRLDWPQGMVACKHGQEWLYVLHSHAVGEELPMPVMGGKPPAPCLRLWKQVQEAAKDEQKAPLLALFCLRKRGFWLVGEAANLLAAIDERGRVKGGTDEVDQ